MVSHVRVLYAGPSAPESAEMKILSAVGRLKDLCSKTVYFIVTTYSKDIKLRCRLDVATRLSLSI